MRQITHTLTEEHFEELSKKLRQQRFDFYTKAEIHTTFEEYAQNHPVTMTFEVPEEEPTYTEAVQYLVTLSKSGQISVSTGEEFILAQINGVNLFYGVNSKVIRAASFHALQIHCKALGLPPITIDQITFVEV